MLYGEYHGMESLVKTLEQLADKQTDVIIAQKERYPHREQLFREQLQEYFELTWVPREETCHELGNISLYKLTKRVK